MSPNSGSVTFVECLNGYPKNWPSTSTLFNSHEGLSSPNQSLPLSVKKSFCVWGWNANPTLFLTPLATCAHSSPSSLRIDAYCGLSDKQILQGAPILKYKRPWWSCFNHFQPCHVSLGRLSVTKIFFGNSSNFCWDASS